jgi:hypothetical protein
LGALPYFTALLKFQVQQRINTTVYGEIEGQAGRPQNSPEG